MLAPIAKFWQELKRRKVIRVAVAYALVAWVVVEVASVLLPTLLLPDWSLRLVTVLALLGFPIAVVLAWVFELTPAGAKFESPAAPAVSAQSTDGSDDDLAEPAAGLPPPASDTRRSIVVLPFVNISDDPGQAWFSDGITEEILTLLALQPDLRVISRTTSFTFRDSGLDIGAIARKLNVELVLEGSVRRAASRVRIMAQLIDAARDEQLWSGRFDRELTDFFRCRARLPAPLSTH